MNLERSFCSAEQWALREIDQDCRESFAFWCWRRTGNISWTDLVRNEEILNGVKEETRIL